MHSADNRETTGSSPVACTFGGVKLADEGSPAALWGIFKSLQILGKNVYIARSVIRTKI